MKDWIPVKTIPMTEEEIKLYADDYDLNPKDPEAVTYRNPMPEDGEVIWITTENGEVRKAECVNDRGLYWLNVYAASYEDNWQKVLAWMPVETPKPYRAPDPRLIDATQLLKAIDANGELTAKDIESLINRQPTLDQRKTALLKIDVKSKVMTCEGCGAQFDVLPVSSYYCPVCGAKWEEIKK